MLSALSERLSTLHYRTLSQKRLLGDPSLLLHNFRLRLSRVRLDLSGIQAAKLSGYAREVGKIRAALLERSPDKQLAVKYQRSLDLERRLRFAIDLTIRQNRGLLGEKIALLDSASPLTVLGRGYSLTRLMPGRTLVRDTSQIEVGSRLEITLQHGTLEAKVVAKSNNGVEGEEKE